MEQTRACAEAATAGRLGRYLGIPKPPERWVQDEVTNAMNRSTPPLALTALLGGLLSSLGGCRNHDKAPPAQPPLVDAAPRTPPTDAARPGLGAYSSVRARFERDCPSDLPGLHVDSTSRYCRTSVASSGRKPLRRWLALHHEKDDSQPRESTERPITRVDIRYDWPAGNGVFRPAPECATLVDEVVAYLRDLTGLTEPRARQVASAMRAHHGPLIRFRAMDRDVCAGSSDTPPPPPALAEEGDEEGCGVVIAECYLFRHMTPPPLDIDLNAIDGSAPVNAPTTNDGGPDGRK
jgi:hypothetical protein